jgi:hypothetical protein
MYRSGWGCIRYPNNLLSLKIATVFDADELRLSEGLNLPRNFFPKLIIVRDRDRNSISTLINLFLVRS